MTRTQIQLPDSLYSQAKQVAERHEISLAELVRRGLEHMVRLYRADDVPQSDWRLPAAQSLGDFLVPVEDWREHANLAGDAGAESR